MKQYRVIIVVLIAACCLATGFFQKFGNLPLVGPQTGQVLNCADRFSSNADDFDIYLTEQTFSESALKAFCQNPVIKRQFGNVRITVGQNDYDTYRYINHGVSDLALVKNNVVSAFGASEIYGYEEVASHQDYAAYFIALKEKPVLSKEYLLGKRIGILDYPSSRSGHIVPKKILKTLDLNPNNVELHYYSSHKEMRRALLSGEVDIISSYWDKNDGEILSRTYITPLENSVKGMRWYLKMQTRNTDLKCAVQNVIQAISAAQNKKYYQQVELKEPCVNANAQ
ncbi:MAG: hypothetical protein CL587_06075 [Alteromonadaceae bacterium]|nr:hypothetical protein [Alteromonadaceae bacterium]